MRFVFLWVFVLMFFVPSAPASAEDLVRVDSRIKTLVFNENEVYSVITKIGYQTVIEIDKSEKIDTISIGDAVGWQITPSKNRIFIKPLLKNTTTNMSLITNKRAYQFELVSESSDSKVSPHAYVVRFFYPDKDQFQYADGDRARAAISQVSPMPAMTAPQMPPQMQMPLQMPTVPEAPSFAPVPAAAMASSVAAMPRPIAPSSAPITSGLPSLNTIGIDSMNFNYTLTGPEAYAPKKIYDDGRNTYFEFGGNSGFEPKFFVMNRAGQQREVPSSFDGAKFVVNAVGARFAVKNMIAEDVVVYNESFVGR